MAQLHPGLSQCRMKRHNFCMAEMLSAMSSISDLNSVLLHMRPPNPQLPMPPGAVCRGAIVDQAIQGFFNQPVDALAIAGQRPIG